MAERVSIVCEDNLVSEVDQLAREYGLPRQEVIRQLMSAGLKELRN